MNPLNNHFLLNAHLCVVTKTKNNIFATLWVNGKVVFVKSCGSLPGMRGSKRYSTVAAELLGKSVFLHLYSFGFRSGQFRILYRFRLNRFSRSFLNGFLLYGRKFFLVTLESSVPIPHSLGLRAKKRRRV